MGNRKRQCAERFGRIPVNNIKTDTADTFLKELTTGNYDMILKRCTPNIPQTIAKHVRTEN